MNTGTLNGHGNIRRVRDMSYHSHWKRNLILSLIVIIAVVVSVVEAFLSMQSPKVHTITIFNDQETVSAGGYNPHPFTMPSGASYSSVSVIFNAQGGSDNDIKMYVMDYANFVNYTNNFDFSYVFYSGQLHAFSGYVNLPSGDYYLVLDNKFSISCQKLVYIQMNATYLE